MLLLLLLLLFLMNVFNTLKYICLTNIALL